MIFLPPGSLYQRYEKLYVSGTAAAHACTRATSACVHATCSFAQKDFSRRRLIGYLGGEHFHACMLRAALLKRIFPGVV